MKKTDKRSKRELSLAKLAEVRGGITGDSKTIVGGFKAILDVINEGVGPDYGF